MLALASAARSASIASAAITLAIGWVATIVWWRTMSSTGMTWGYSIIDIFTAAYFFHLSKRRHFPRPLFALHFSAILFQAAASVMGFDYYWVTVAINRYFELSLLYVSGCALFRIVGRRRWMKEGRAFQRALYRSRPYARII